MEITELVTKIVGNPLVDRDIIKYCKDFDKEDLKALLQELSLESIACNYVDDLSTAHRIDEACNLISKQFNADLWEDEVPQPLKNLLPDKLKSDEAVSIFQKAINAKLISKAANILIWNDTKQLLAYFAEKMSDKFTLTTKLDRDGKKTVSWKPFETLFNEKDLKGAKQNWMRITTKFEPTGFEKVDALIK